MQCDTPFHRLSSGWALAAMNKPAVQLTCTPLCWPWSSKSRSSGHDCSTTQVFLSFSFSRDNGVHGNVHGNVLKHAQQVSSWGVLAANAALVLVFCRRVLRACFAGMF